MQPPGAEFDAATSLLRSDLAEEWAPDASDEAALNFIQGILGALISPVRLRDNKATPLRAERDRLLEDCHRLAAKMKSWEQARRLQTAAAGGRR